MNLQLDKGKARLLLTSVSRSLKELERFVKTTPLPSEAKRKVMGEVTLLMDIGDDINMLWKGVPDKVTTRVQKLEAALKKARGYVLEYKCDDEQHPQIVAIDEALAGSSCLEKKPEEDDEDGHEIDRDRYDYLNEDVRSAD